MPNPQQMVNDINVASYLHYHGIEPENISVQEKNNNKKVVFHYNSNASEVINDFYSDPSPMVELKRYNLSRAEMLKRANHIKGGR